LSDESKYLIEDKTAEKEYDFSLKDSLERAQHNKIYLKKTFFITPNVKPPPIEMKMIIHCAGLILLIFIGGGILYQSYYLGGKMIPTFNANKFDKEVIIHFLID
jgi:hypothetical protein